MQGRGSCQRTFGDLRQFTGKAAVGCEGTGETNRLRAILPAYAPAKYLTVPSSFDSYALSAPSLSFDGVVALIDPEADLICAADVKSSQDVESSEWAANQRCEACELDTLRLDSMDHLNGLRDGFVRLSREANDEANAPLNTLFLKDTRPLLKALDSGSLVNAVEDSLTTRLKTEVNLMTACRSHSLCERSCDLISACVAEPCQVNLAACHPSTESESSAAFDGEHIVDERDFTDTKSSAEAFQFVERTLN
jgi:hypothetical protein